jgi:hypothetical protein
VGNGCQNVGSGNPGKELAVGTVAMGTRVGTGAVEARAIGTGHLEPEQLEPWWWEPGQSELGSRTQGSRTMAAGQCPELSVRGRGQHRMSGHVVGARCWVGGAHHRCIGHGWADSSSVPLP